MIEKEKLKYWAIQLEREITININSSNSAFALNQMPKLLSSIEDAKDLKISQSIENLIDYSKLYKCGDFGTFKYRTMFRALSYFDELVKGFPLIEKEKLKYWAIELENEIAKYKDVSSGAKYLSQRQYVLGAIEDAKNLKIELPSDRLGNSRPLDECTDIHKYQKLSNAFSAFSLLIGGLRLPNDPPKVDQ
jgi:hypothetical protein